MLFGRNKNTLINTAKQIMGRQKQAEREDKQTKRRGRRGKHEVPLPKHALKKLKQLLTVSTIKSVNNETNFRLNWDFCGANEKAWSLPS